MALPSRTHLVLIPSYNSGQIVLDVVKEALNFWRPVWVVVDGSDDGSGEKLEQLRNSEPDVTVIRHSVNRGKGSAVYSGVREALSLGFTHILAMDADGQHPADAIPEFMQRSLSNPDAMILGLPVFDDSAPAVRVKGRKISNFWVDLETFWAGIGDSLFGFRIYPAAALKSVMDSTRYARRFDFDPEAVVRLAWRDVPAINLDVPVRYLSAEEGGVSHFNYFRDNVLLTWMHIRLVFGFLRRLPRLAMRRWRGRDLMKN
ncbi:MAG: glycosyltransferase family 2 protein [Gammaproteobacteria bacterium]